MAQVFFLGYVTRASHAFDARKARAGYSLVINVLDLAAGPRLAGLKNETGNWYIRVLLARSDASWSDLIESDLID